jgi:hypothetical protein
LDFLDLDFLDFFDLDFLDLDFLDFLDLDFLDFLDLDFLDFFDFFDFFDFLDLDFLDLDFLVLPPFPKGNAEHNFPIHVLTGSSVGSVGVIEVVLFENFFQPLSSELDAVDAVDAVEELKLGPSLDALRSVSLSIGFEEEVDISGTDADIIYNIKI